MRTIVLLAYYYPPLGGVGSQRALSFARHLPEMGWRAVVVTPRRGAYGLDPSLGNGEREGVRVVRTGSLEPAVLARRIRPGAGARSAAGDMVEGPGSRGVGALVRSALSATVYFPDHARGWSGHAARAAARAVRESGACAIVSTSPPVSAHVAALRAARDAAVPALLDFRDLWTAHRDESDRSRRAQRERRLERDLLRDAAAVTSVSDACVAWLRERHGEDAAGKPFRVLRNGFEAEDFAGPAPPRDPDVFRIVHAGTVYGARQDTSAFFRALARVRAAGTLRDRRVEVVLAGKVDPQTLESARAGGCGDLVLTPGFVDHPTAVGLMRSASVNLLLTWSVEGPVAAGVCPGKMYEQMAAGRPVLALALPSCEAVRILDATGGALVARPDDEAAIERALVRLAEADRAGDALRAAPARTRDLARFSRKSVAAELAELLASIAG